MAGILGGSILGNFTSMAESPAPSRLATVKATLLPVYSKTSVSSGIVKFLRKGNVVRVQSEIVVSDDKWCSIAEYRQATRSGFVICEALEYSQQQQRVTPLEKKGPAIPLTAKETRPSTLPIASKSQIRTQHPPYPGKFLYALWQADMAEVKDLLQKGSDPNAQTSCGTRPLLIAAKMKNSELVRLLIENGADVGGRDRSGMTALMSAASVGQARNVEVLIDAGTNLNARDNDGFTALMWATMKGFPEVVKIFLAHGADVHAKTKEDLTAWHLSKRIIEDIESSLAEDPGASNRVALSELRRDLAKHEKVLHLLERAGGREPGRRSRVNQKTKPVPHAQGNGRVHALRQGTFTILDPGLANRDSDFS
jgi:hypothetical protein